jgi:hypothetical protein
MSMLVLRMCGWMRVMYTGRPPNSRRTTGRVTVPPCASFTVSQLHAHNTTETLSHPAATHMLYKARQIMASNLTCVHQLLEIQLACCWPCLCKSDLLLAAQAHLGSKTCTGTPGGPWTCTLQAGSVLKKLSMSKSFCRSSCTRLSIDTRKRSAQLQVPQPLW